MNLDNIKTLWTNTMAEDIEANRIAWDSVAGDYLYDETTGLDADPFLKYIQQKLQLSENMTVLGAGCGPGGLSVALSAKVGHVTGVDFSPEMIRNARGYVREHNISNVEFLERDWWNCDGDEFKGKYDFVFAHTTPAIADYESLLKMMRAATGYCALCKPARRSDRVMDALRELTGLEKSDSDQSVAYAFDTIWGHGCNPELTYHTTVWNSEKKLEDAKKWYLNRLKGVATLSEETEKKVCDYLEKISVDGMIKDTTHTTLVTIFWEVKR